jgi:hypothetical protein
MEKFHSAASSLSRRTADLHARVVLGVLAVGALSFLAEFVRPGLGIPALVVALVMLSIWAALLVRRAARLRRHVLERHREWRADRFEKRGVVRVERMGDERNVHS